MPLSAYALNRIRRMSQRGLKTAYALGRAARLNEIATGRARRCVKFSCNYAWLAYRKAGDQHNNQNGNFTVSAPGWYCPNCGGGYGGSP